MSRPRQLTRAEAIAECNRLNRENGVLSVALSAAMNEKAAATETARHQDRRYVFRLYRATGAHGGIVVETFHCKGQKPSSTAHYLEDLLAAYRQRIYDPSGETAEIREAIGRLRVKRDQLVDEHYAVRHAIPAGYRPLTRAETDAAIYGSCTNMMNQAC